MHSIVIFATFLVIVFAGCKCPGRCDSLAGYSGTDAQCFCFCAKTASSLKLDRNTRCTWVPKSTFSKGACAFCSPSIQTPFDSIFSLDVSLSLGDGLESAPVSYDPYLFPVQRCFCYNGNCNGYSGSSDSCVAWGKSISSRFLDGKHVVKYFPRSSFSVGGCTVCGNMDSCKL
ncbi:hypothetical protein RCL1_008049 [Eukaryota sp. TZLM3-RCL]